jgi:hypothetical protein
MHSRLRLSVAVVALIVLAVTALLVTLGESGPEPRAGAGAGVRPDGLSTVRESRAAPHTADAARRALGAKSDGRAAARRARLEEKVALSAHSGELGVPGMSERQLERFETSVLGPEHAREHAQLRRTAREAAARGEDGAPESVRATAAAAGPPEQVGRWQPAFPIPVMAIHAAVLPTGKVLWFAYPKNPNPRKNGGDLNAANTSQAWLWDPATGQNKRVDPPLWRDPADGQLKPANIWCGGQAFTADGRVVVVGGNLQYSPPAPSFKGLNKVYTFNPFNETWTEQPDMRHGRWYPTIVRLPDGRMPILSGWDERGNSPPAYDTDVEVFTPSADLNGRGTVTYIGARPQIGGLYPHMFVMPSGRALVAGPFPEDTWMMNSPGASSFGWSNYPNLQRDRLWGSAVLLPGGAGGSTKVMGLGGSAPPSITSTTTDIAVGTTEVFDEATSSAGFKPASSMNVGRGHLNTVLLPDGSMVTVGGGVGIRNGDQWEGDEAQKQVELWSPSTARWTLGPSQAEKRTYHSVAMLLPDGRVISAGDDFNGGYDKDTAEIYEPPYLFKGGRPSISWAPGAVRTGATFEVDTADTNIARATLIAPSAVTHANDMNQRALQLPVARRAGGVTVTAPTTAAAAPPGYYMLFLVNDQGVPSVAKFVRLSVDGAASALPEEPRPGSTVPTAPGQQGPGSTPPTPPGQGGPGSTPTTGDGAWRLSMAQGERIARRALAKEFGRRYRRRARLRERCTHPEESLVSCSVSWLSPPSGQAARASARAREYSGVVRVRRTGAKSFTYRIRMNRRLGTRRLAPIERSGRL